jgi:hypothetical protein
LKCPEAAVVARERALADHHMDFDRGLLFSRRGEHLDVVNREWRPA